MQRVFIDGNAGTTGLRIEKRLSDRRDIELLSVPAEYRKDPAAKRDILNNRCDVAILCLPDDASREDVAMIENPDVTVLDTSTAHRTDTRFAYGFPELSPAHREAVRVSRRVSVPGCHASGFVALVYPLVEAGLISPDIGLVCHSLTGYSGGGRKMIAQYEAASRDDLLRAPRQYGLGQTHKHLREMTSVTHLTCPPIFCPIVADFYSGMEVTVALFARDMHGTADDVRRLYKAKYAGHVVRYREDDGEDGFLSAGAMGGRDGMVVSVHGNEERILLTARYDNLGKGSSGAAIQCLNLVLGVAETVGLDL